MDDDITVSTEHKFTVEQLEMLLEALSVYIDFGRRARTALFDSKNRMISKRRLQELKNTDELAKMLMSGEANVKWVPIGPKFTDTDAELAEEIHEMFLNGLATLEEKIDNHNTKLAEENIDSVVDGLYEMLRDNNDK
jgi:hypothetical protein